MYKLVEIYGINYQFGLHTVEFDLFNIMKNNHYVINIL